MPLVIAAIRTGTDPIGKLPEASFHRWLEDQLNCPKCDATYNLVCDYDAAIGRHFPEESRKLIQLLRKAIFLGHGDGHRISHFQTAGVVVTSFGAPPAPPPAPQKPAPQNPAPQNAASQHSARQNPQRPAPGQDVFPPLPRRYRIH